jgi:hypothetical protein
MQVTPSCCDLMVATRLQTRLVHMHQRRFLWPLKRFLAMAWQVMIRARLLLRAITMAAGSDPI